jgi:hypothetical protein
MASLPMAAPKPANWPHVLECQGGTEPLIAYWVLDGYLIQWDRGWSGSAQNPFWNRHLARVAVLDGYLIAGSRIPS